MPARGRRTPTIYKPAEHYLNRIQVFHPYQLRLKDQLLDIFAYNEEETVLLRPIHSQLSDGLLFSRESVTNTDVYRCLRDALESRGMTVPVTVAGTPAGSFISKRNIAEIWHDPNNKVKREALLLEYHNIRQDVLKNNREIVQERQNESTIARLAPPSGPGQSSSRRHTQEEITADERNIRHLSQEEKPITN